MARDDNFAPFDFIGRCQGGPYSGMHYGSVASVFGVVNLNGRTGFYKWHIQNYWEWDQVTAPTKER